MKKILASLAITASLLTACGLAPAAGDKCEKANTGACDSSNVALFCESGSLKTFQCRGPTGCISDGDRLTCDFTKALAGDPCLQSQQDQAMCSAADPNAALICRNGTFQTQACKGCLIQNGNVMCLQ